MWIKLDARFFEDRRIALGPPLTAHVYLQALTRSIDQDLLRGDVEHFVGSRRNTKAGVRAAITHLESVGAFTWDGDVLTVHHIWVEGDVTPNASRTIPERTRERVFRRDNWRCRHCGVTAVDGALLEIDHKHPWSRGGSNREHNLQTLCSSCNARKGDT